VADPPAELEADETEIYCVRLKRK